MLTRAVMVASLLGLARVAEAQACDTPVPILVGSEWELYARTIQVAGAAPAVPWTIRSFGPRQYERLASSDSTLPWVHESVEFSRSRCGGRFSLTALGPRAQLVYNASFPFSFNDGAIAAGRGMTAAVDGGVSSTAGPLTMTIAPIAYMSQNAAFRTRANGLGGKGSYADWRNPASIDLPQRFGDKAYARLDPGQSSVRLDLAGAALGLSTENQFFGPAYEHPIILGNNAGGFPHVFLGSSHAVRLGFLGAVHARIFWGKLSESEFSALADSGFSRLASGFVAVYQPVPPLEIGATRFVHVLQDRFRFDIGEVFRPFGFLLGDSPTGQSVATNEPDNQLLSVFARLVLPGDGLEVYGEFGREDRNADQREFIYFLDHDSAYLIGLRKVWRGDASIVSMRAEVLNSRVTHLALSSNQALWYTHQEIQQGHTQRGEALGSFAAYGGGASVLSVERYDRRGRWRVEWQRVQRAESRVIAPDQLKADVAHMLGASVLRFGRRAHVELGLAGIYEFNRYLEKDAASVRTSISVRPAMRHVP